VAAESVRREQLIITKLLQSEEPSIRFKVLTRVLGQDPGSGEVRRLQEDIRASPRVRRLLSEQQADGRLPHHPYAKWDGAHWVLVALADLGYPPGDERLIPLREQVYAWLLNDAHLQSIKPIAGRTRVHASQEGNALYALLTLGLADGRTQQLARALQRWQWPDGGWNCDKDPRATNSSFMESLIPLRGLALHGRLMEDQPSQQAAERAAQVFLKRRLFRREHGGALIRKEFTLLHYPCYWHYDILFGLTVMAEAGRLEDERCREALELLESKRLADGGFPAERTYYQSGPRAAHGRSLVRWGATGETRMNEFVTAETLAVLKVAGRLKL